MPDRLHKASLFLANYAEIVTGLCEVNPEAAERFCDAVERALALLERHPLLGSKAGFRHAPEVRKWVIQPFHNYVLFYLPTAGGIVLVRYCCTARGTCPC